MIAFGPFLSRKGNPETLPSVISYTGFVLEFASKGCSGMVPIYCIPEGRGGIGDLFFLEKDAICPVRLFEGPLSDEYLGKPHSLESLITTLYLNYHAVTPLTEFLHDIREKIDLKPGNEKRRANFKELLRKDIEDAGFELIDFWQYGRTLTISFGWVFEQDRSGPHSPLCLYAGAFECRPTPDRQMGKGKWLMPMETIVGYLFIQQLKKMCRGNPVEMLNSEGIGIALETFKWTKVSLLTPKELKKERIEFVRQHPSLHQNPLELAKAMKKAGLYSDTVENYAISKQMLRLIKAAKESP